MVNALGKKLKQKQDFTDRGLEAPGACPSCGGVKLWADTLACAYCTSGSAGAEQVVLINGLVRPWRENPLVAKCEQLFGCRIFSVERR
jgi:hypothetical protein